MGLQKGDDDDDDDDDGTHWFNLSIVVLSPLPADDLPSLPFHALSSPNTH
jgi:hypothetical protein